RLTVEARGEDQTSVLFSHYAATGQSKPHASMRVQSNQWVGPRRESWALSDCPRREQTRLRREQGRLVGSAYIVGRTETCALTTRHPSRIRTQVWLCRPRRPDSTRCTSLLPVAH